MARFEFIGTQEYMTALKKLGDEMEPTLKDMVKAGCNVLLARLKGAVPQFAQYIKTVKFGESKNGGRYGVVGYKGKTSSGAESGLAASVYERGREYHKQEARQFTERTVSASTPEVKQAMQDVYDKKIKSLGF